MIPQKCNVACRGIGRTIVPGRVELIDVEVPISCGGVFKDLLQPDGDRPGQSVR